MSAINQSVAVLVILLIVITIFLGWRSAATTYCALLLIGNIVALPATIMMLAAPVGDEPVWKRIVMPILTITVYSPSMPIMLAKEMVIPSYRSHDIYNDDDSPYDDDPESKQ